MAAHSNLGASSSDRWMSCPGSVALSKDMPPQKQSVHAAEGSAAHAVAERCVKDNRDANSYWGNMVTDDGRMFPFDEDLKERLEGEGAFVFEVDADMTNAVQVYVDHFRAEFARMFREYGVKPVVMVEQRFDLTFIKAGMFGTNDLSLFVPGKELSVIDYKHGRGKVVEAEDNPQLSYYALGALHQLCYDLIADEYVAATMPDIVNITVVQPRAYHKRGPVRTWRVDPNYIVYDFAAVLKDTALLTSAPDAPLNAGDWCRWCQAKPICPALQSKALTEMSEALGDVSDLFETIQDVDTAKKVGRLKAIELARMGSPERLRQALDMLPLLEEWCRSIALYAQGELEAGRPVPGYKLVQKKTRRRWKHEGKALDALRNHADFGQLTVTKLRTPAQVEKIVDKKTLAILIETPEGGLTLTREDDDRPAVAVTHLIGDFSDVFEDDLSIL